MKKIILILVTFFACFAVSAQDWNPYVNQGIISPAPMLPLEFGGTGVISFNIGNTGISPLLYDPADPNMNMTLVLTLSDGVPDNADPLAALGGTWVNKFSWSYNPAVKTYIANQIADILGDSQGTITVQYKVINNTPLTTSSNGFNVNLQPNPYSNGSNNTGDDAVSSYTFTRAYDFGDAPVSYGEARHEINVFRDPDQEFQYTKYIVLGSTVDPENVKATSATANGDDLNGSDDENGVVIPALTQGTTVTLGVNVTAHELSTGYLNAWFDWNGDGDFLDVGERVTPTAIAATQTGVYNITLNVPLNAITTAPTFARFRVGPANNAFADASYRENTYGEAEDYMITIVPKSLSIGDYVWDDLDGDGIQDSVELGLSGVIVELYDCNSNGSPLSSVTTDATGLYLFENVIVGNYYIKFILPGTNKFTLANQGASDLVDSDVTGNNGFGTTACFQVNVNEERHDIDAGVYRCVEIGDLVWLDYNEDNKYNTGESGVNGLRVELYRQTNGNWVLWDYDYTGISPNSICGDGYYNFCANPGTYYIKFITPPIGLVPAQANVGGNDTIDSDITRAFGHGTTDQFVLVSGTSGNLNIDAGYYGMAQVSNSLAWIDNNTNGLRETSEPGLANAEVEIYDSEGDLYSTTMTDASGQYDLTYLQAENYFVKFKIPAPYNSSYGFTSPDQGDELYDSDVTHINGFGTTNMFYLNPEDDTQHLDAGIAAGALPLNFLTVGAKWVYDHTVVNWATANEKDVDKFIVQRSYHTADKFENIGEIPAKNESSNSYQLADKGDFKEGIYYYRVMQYDKDGKYTKSKVVAVFVDRNNETGKYTVYPNPVAEDAKVDLILTESSDIMIDLLDLNGKMAIANIVNEAIGAGVHDIAFNVSSLKPATYMLRIQEGEKIEFMEVIVIKK